MAFTLRIVEPVSSIEKKMFAAIAVELDKKLRRSKKRLDVAIRPIISEALSSSPELLSLSSGKLHTDFGIPSGSNPAPLIIDAIMSSTIVITKKVSPNLRQGGLQVLVQPNSFSNLIGKGFGVTTTELGVKLPWLEWLLTSGDAVIVGDFGVEYNPGTGRSGGGTMKAVQRPFKVDSAYSGTLGNNFITRALIKKAAKIVSTIARVVKNA